MKSRIRSFLNTESGTVTKNFFYLGLVQGSNFILPLIAIPYLVRVLGDENYGIVLFAQSIALYLVLLTDYGIETYGTKEIALVRDDSEKLNRTFSALMSLKSILFLVSLALLAIAIFHPKLFEIKEAILLSLGIVVSNLLFPLWYYLGTEKMKLISILNISAKAIFTGLIFVFVKEKDDFDITLALHSVGYIVAGIASVLILRQLKVKFIKPSFSEIWLHAKNSFWYFLSRLAGNLFTFSNVFILGMLSPAASVGAAVADFGIAEKLFRALQGMYDPIVKSLYPNMVKTRDKRVFKRFFLIFTLGNLLVCVIAFLLSYQIMHFIFGKEPSADSIAIFKILLFAQAITVPSILIGYPFLGSLGFEKAVNLSGILAAVFHLTIITILVSYHSFNPFSLAYLLVFTEAFIFVYRLIIIIKHRIWQINL